MLNQWITSDKSNSINGWDINNELLEFRISSPKIKNSIIDIVELSHLKLVAIGFNIKIILLFLLASLDRTVTIWDLFKKSLIISIDLTQGGIHSLVYF